LLQRRFIGTAVLTESAKGYSTTKLTYHVRQGSSTGNLEDDEEMQEWLGHKDMDVVDQVRLGNTVAALESLADWYLNERHKFYDAAVLYNYIMGRKSKWTYCR
jgi:hypothetical protein